MNDKLRHTALGVAAAALIMSTSAAVAAQGNAAPDAVSRHISAVDNVTAAMQRRPDGAGKLLSSTKIEDLDPSLVAVAARAKRVTYLSTSLQGKPTEVSGVILTPKGKTPKGGWPVVSWAHGSSGISDACAPSTAASAAGTVDLYGYSGFIAELLEAGYAVAATDYEGLGTEGDHPYIIANSEARGVIDAVRAAGQADPSLSKTWFSVGHSQGGQAAIAAGELAKTWGKGLNFRGTVGLAPVTDIGSAYSYGSPGPVDRGFYLLALHGLQTQHPGLRFEDYLGDRALSMLPIAEDECTAKIWEVFSADLGDDFGDYEFTPQSPKAALKLQRWLDAQSVPRTTTPGPMLLLQGSHDPSIKMAVTRQAVANARAAGTAARFRLYPGMDHYAVLGSRKDGGAADDVIAWLNRHLGR
ncbi:lipase family protein [Alloalcanivorax gelatiniphagus]